MTESPVSCKPPGDTSGRSPWTYTRIIWTGTAATLIILLTIALATYAWRSYRLNANNARDRQWYLELDSLLVQIQQARENPSPDFSLILDKAKTISAEIATALTGKIDSQFSRQRGLRSVARNDLPQLIQSDLTTVSEAEQSIARTLIRGATQLGISLQSIPDPDPQVAAALAEVKRLGGIVTSDPSRLIQPVTAIKMKGNQFHDLHLDHLPNIASLEIESPEITDAGLQKLRHLRSLRVCRLTCPKITDAGIASLAGLPALNEVCLYNCPQITGSGVLQLQRPWRLALFGSHITDQTLAVLKNLPNLQDLWLRSDSLTNDGVASLAKIPRLTALILSHCHNLDETSFARVSEMQNLEKLGIQGANITDAGLESIGKLPQLQQLFIFPCDDNTPYGLQITDMGLARMRNLNSLQSLEIKSCPSVTDASVAVLQKSASLKTLSLDETGITADGHSRLVSALPDTQIRFIPTPASPLDGNLTADHPDDVSSDQLEAECRAWPVPSSQASPSASCTMDELQHEFRTSNKTTDAKYDGKLIELSGQVVSVGKNLEGDSVIQLCGSERHFEVQCVVRSTTDLTHVVEGETCRLRGVYCISILPTFVHCTVMKSGQVPTTDAVAESGTIEGSNQLTPEVILTAEQLESEVAADPEATHRKYRGKVMQITGPLSRISQVVPGAMRYHLGPPLSLQYFLRTGNPWYCVRPGQTITLIGKWFSDYPCLVNCQVTQVSGKPNLILTAAALGEYLESDPVKFRKWFYLEQIIVTGEVIEKSQPQPDFTGSPFTIKLRSTQNTTVVCELEADECEAAESVRMGDTVKVAGWNTKETPTDSIILVQSLFWRGK